MTVSELIEWLRTQPQGAKVLIHDADTGWFLEAKTGPLTRNILDPDSSDVPDNSVCIHGDYH